MAVAEADRSLLGDLASLPEAARERVYARLAERCGRLPVSVLDDPRLRLRKKQALMWEEDWRWRVYVAGRRWGKNFAMRAAIEEAVTLRGIKSIVIVGQTFSSFEKIIVNPVSGSSLRSLPSQPVIRGGTAPMITWPDYGATAFFVSADSPSGMYGLGAQLVIMDEAGDYPTRAGVSAWDEANIIASEGSARIIVTTSPYPQGESLPRLRALIAQPDALVTRGTTFENTALTDDYLDSLRREYEGTSYYAAMVEGEVLDDIEGALWGSADVRRAKLVLSRSGYARLMALCDRVIVAIDPATTVSEKSHDAGIVVAGRYKERAFVFESMGLKVMPDVWARKAAELYAEYDASEVIAETNQGGAMVERLMEATGIGTRYREIRSTRNKAERAVPVRDLYRQRRVYHVVPEHDVTRHERLENQMLTFVDPQPRHAKDDILDALVFAVDDLLSGGGRGGIISLW